MTDKSRRRAELDLAVLEDELVEAKASDASPAKLRKLKDKVREARAAFRADRDGGPATIEVKTNGKGR